MDKTKKEADENQSKHTLTPKLRFPEFQGAGAWEEKKLGEIADIRTGKKNLQDKKDNGIYPFFVRSKNIEKIDSYSYDGEAILIPGDGQIGQVYHYINGKFDYHQRVYKISDGKNLNLQYLYFYLSLYFYKYAISFSVKATVDSLRLPIIKSFKIKAPSLPEQKKIADCLSSLDELIEMQEQKLKTLKKHKKGLMQQLFPAEGETTPKLRFPEFQKAGAWEEKEIGQIFNLKRGCVLSMNLIKFEQTRKFTYPVYSSQTKNNGLTGYYQEFLYEDAITWTTDGANAGDVNYREGRFYCTNVCGVLLEKDGYSGYANLFTASILNSVSKNHVSYVGNPKLMNGVMSKIIIPFPSLPEQQKIAACLSSLDELIAAQEQKLETLKKHKKGLMQQLFPTI